MPDRLYQRLLEGNREFVAASLDRDPEFFVKLSQGQSPKVLWIGCADSRVPATQITSMLPGEIFVHRNIANLVVHSDMNCLSVMEYAVKVLEVEHVIVCGHYGCGGVKAAMSNSRHGNIDNWLRHIKDVYRLHQSELEGVADLQDRERLLVELNVKEQVYNVCKTSIIQDAWEKRSLPHIHGWVYDLSTGYIKDLKVNITGREDLLEIYRFESQTRFLS